MAKTGYITGMKEALATLRDLDEAVQRDILEEAIDVPTDIMQREVQARAPVSPRANNSTPGSLKASVKKVKPKATKKYRTRREIQATDVAAVPTEFGLSSRDYPAQPWFRPAVDSKRNEAAQALANNIRSQIENGPWVKGRG